MNIGILLESICLAFLVSGFGFAFVILYNVIAKTKEEFRKDSHGIVIVCGTFCTICLVFGGIFAALKASYINIPEAMDVYKGKTEIQYTVKGGIKTDSVVVFKEGYGRD